MHYSQLSNRLDYINLWNPRILVLNNQKLTDAYLGLLYAMEDLAVYVQVAKSTQFRKRISNALLATYVFRYGFMMNTRVKIILVIAVTDNVIKDADVKAVS